MNLLKEDGEILCLIKPQFEAGKDKVGKNGVVRDKDTHREVIEDILNFSLECGLKIKGLDFSPIKGPEGNIEFLAYLSKIEGSISFDAKKVVDKSHEDLII